MRHALRLAARNPFSTSAALGALALAIGACTLVFSIVQGVLLRQMPYRDADRLVVVWETNLQRSRLENTASPANFLYWRDRAHSFVDLAAVAMTFRVPTSVQGQAPEMVPLQMVSAPLFPMLGVSPAAGRVFTDDEDRNQAEVVVVSHRYGQSHLGGERSAIGRSITINGRLKTVIGVMPAGFSVLDPEVDLWVPTGFGEEDRTPHGRYLSTVGRLKPGVTVAAAQSDMTGVSAELTKKFPAFDTGWATRVVPLHRQVTGKVRPALLILSGAVGCVLLIACANVANLLLARSTARRRELAVRAALGAGRGRLVRQLLAESLLLSAAAGTCGWLIAMVGLRLLQGGITDSSTIPRLADVSLDPMVALFAIAVSLATAVLAGSLPAIAATRLALVEALKDGVRGSTSMAGTRLRPALVAGQVALAVILVAGAGLLVRSLAQVLDVKPGFTSQGVTTLPLALAESSYATPESRTAFYREVVARAAALPGVDAAGAVSFLPMTGLASATTFTVVGRPAPAAGDEPVADVRIVSGDYFRAMGVPLVRGRLFEDGDSGPRAHVVVINQALADALFPHQDPLGQELHISWDSDLPDRIVGVVGNVRHDSLEAPVRPMTYWPHTRFANTFMTLVVKSRQPLLAIGAEVTSVVRAVDAGVPAGTARPLDDVIRLTLATRRLVMTLLAAFAVVALVLAALGIYAVTSAVVAERRGELAIRMALGAAPGRVLRLIVGQALRTALIGAAIGIAGALALGRLLEGMLFEVRPTDPAAMLAAVLALVGVAVLAGLVPGRIAASVDPMESLKAD